MNERVIKTLDALEGEIQRIEIDLSSQQDHLAELKYYRERTAITLGIELVFSN